MSRRMLILRLDGVLQSWGSPARWTIRGSYPFPAKSAVIGLIACAMGEMRESDVIRKLDRHLRMGCRNDKPGKELVDYHTVSGALMNAEGNMLGKKGEEATILTERAYLQDAIYTVVLESIDDTGDALLVVASESLRSPAWPVYLGRKSCVPSRPVFDGLSESFASIKEALSLLPLGWDVENNRDAKCIEDRLKCLCWEEDPHGQMEVCDGVAIGSSRRFSTHNYVTYPVQASSERRGQDGVVFEPADVESLQ